MSLSFSVIYYFFNFFFFNIFISVRRLFFREFIEILLLSVFLILSSFIGPKFIFINIRFFILIIFADLNFIFINIKSFSSFINVRVSAVKVQISNIFEIILSVCNFLVFSFVFVLKILRSFFSIFYSRYYSVEIYLKILRDFIINLYKFSINNA